MCQVGEDDYDISKLWLAQKRMLLALSTGEEHTHEHVCTWAWRVSQLGYFLAVYNLEPSSSQQ